MQNARDVIIERLSKIGISRDVAGQVMCHRNNKRIIELADELGIDVELLQNLAFRSPFLASDRKTIVDSSTSGSSRTIQPGRAYLFDGSSSVELSENLKHPSGFSVCVWVKSNDLAATGGFFCNTGAYGTGFMLGQQGGHFTLFMNNYLNGPDMTGEWQHVVATYDGTTAKIFVDGRLEASAAKTFVSPLNNATFLGRWYNYGYGIYDGKMFDFRYYDNPLSQAEVNHVFTQGELGDSPQGLVANYKCDDAEDVAYDSSGNKIHGIKLNATLPDFHYEGEDVPCSLQNQVGYSDGGSGTSEFVTNGDFSTDTDWTKGTGWTISGGKIIHTGAGDYFEQTNTDIIVGMKYRVTVEVLVADGSGFPQIYMGGLSTGMLTVGTHTFDIIATNYKIKFRGLNDCEIGNISMVEFADADQLLPRDESSLTLDIFGNPLQYSGRVPHNGLLVNGHCGTFNSSNAYIQPTTPISEPDFPYSISFKFKSDNISTHSSLAGKWINGLITLNSKLCFYRNSANYRYSGTVLNSNQWYHVVLIVSGLDRPESSIYVDGQLDDAVTSYVGDGPVVAEYRVSDSSSGKSLNGSMSNFQMWDRELSESEILSLSRGENVDGSVLHYPIAEGAGSRAFDVSGNNNHGRISNVDESSFWSQNQDDFHYNLNSGFEKAYEHAQQNTDNFIKSSYTATLRNLFRENDVTAIEAELMQTHVGFGGYVCDTGYLNPVAVVINANGTVRVFYRSSGGASTSYLFTGIPQDTWTIIKVEFDKPAGEIRLYFDGALVQTHSTVIEPLSVGSSFLTIGQYQNLASPMPGLIKSLRFFVGDVVQHEYLAINEFKDEVGSLDCTITGSIPMVRVPIAGSTALSNPAVIGHNNAESLIDFTGGQDQSPWLNQLWKGYSEFNGTDAWLDIGSVVLEGDFDIKFSAKVSGVQNFLGDSGTDGASLMYLHSGNSLAVRIDYANNTFTWSEPVNGPDLLDDYVVSRRGDVVTATRNGELAFSTGNPANGDFEFNSFGRERASFGEGIFANFEIIDYIDSTVDLNIPMIKNFLDHGPNSHHPEVNNVVLAKGDMESSPGGYALFDGQAGTRLNLASRVSLSGDFTFFAREHLFIGSPIYAMLASTAGSSGDADNSYIFHMNNNTLRLKTISGTVDVTSGLEFKPNEDFSIAIRRDGSTVTIFKNGEAGATTATVVGGLLIDMIGNYYSDAIVLDGRLSELSIFDSALTDDQIADLNRGETIAGAILQMPLTQDARDTSGNGNHGTIDGGITFPENNFDPAYSFGDARIHPNYVNHDSDIKENNFYTEVL